MISYSNLLWYKHVIPHMKNMLNRVVNLELLVPIILLTILICQKTYGAFNQEANSGYYNFYSSHNVDHHDILDWFGVTNTCVSTII